MLLLNASPIILLITSSLNTMATDTLGASRLGLGLLCSV